MGDERRRFELSVPQIGGSALAAVTAAVAASYLGVAGTVIGAAVVSVASTVASAVYTHYLKRTGEKVKQHTVIARLHHGGDPEPPAEDQGELATAARATVRDDEPARTTLVMAPVTPPRRGLSWSGLALAAALVFAVSMGVILGYQALTQTTVAEQVRGEVPKRADERDKAPVQDVRKSVPPETERPAAPTPSVTVTVTSTPTTTPPSETPEPTPTPEPTGGPETSQPSPEQTPPEVTDETPPAAESPVADASPAEKPAGAP